MNGLTHDLKNIIAEVTSFPRDELNIEKNLVDYGFDSISLTRLANAIYTELGLEVTPAVLLEYKTIADVVRYLESLQPESDTVAPTATTPPQVDTPEPLVHSGPSVWDDIFAQEVSQPDVMAKPPQEKSTPVSNDIAVIGLSGEFPGADSPDALWELLTTGKSSITSPPSDRNQLFINEKEFAHGWPDYKTGFIEDVDKFDANFFNMSPREAKHLDPQQRLLLKHSWIALEEAGCPMDELAEKQVGVFVGISTADYRTIVESTGKFDSHYTTGIAHTMAANRISWFLGLTGPSISVDTACSSSLVALHQAVKAIHNGECEMAIVGASNSILHPGLSHACMQAGMLSQSGACHTFDAKADGYVRGEGCGVVIIKSMKQAALDKDTIQAVIKGTATNHGGPSRSLTVPNSEAQAAVISAALQQAQLSLSDISYIEAHGTGTHLGDPVEVNGLKHLLHDGSLPEHFKCGIGSVKGNIGHLEAAAGMAGLIKTILMFRHRKLPKNATFQTMNPYIDLRDSPYFIVDRMQSWETGGKPRRAGVSSFGLGGSNAHVIVQEPEALPYSEPESTDKALWCLFSAPSQPQLQQHIVEVISYLNQHTDVSLARLAYNLRGKKSHAQRLAVMATDISELLSQLNGWLRSSEKVEGVLSGADPRTREFVQYSSDLGISAEELSEFFVMKKNMTTLIHLWLSGLFVPWSSLFPEKYRNIALPCRPFNPQSHWIDVSSGVSVGQSSVVIDSVAPQAERMHNRLQTEQPVNTQRVTTKITLAAPESTQRSVSSVSPSNRMTLEALGDTYSFDQTMDTVATLPTAAVSQSPARTEGVDIQTLKVLLADTLGTEPSEVDDDKPFSEMGLDSILGVEFVGKMNQQFSLSLNASMLYEHVTLQQLARHLALDVASSAVTEHTQKMPNVREVNQQPISDVTFSTATPLKGVPSSHTDQTGINETLKTLLADTLGMEASDIDDDKPFSEMGLDSILGVEFISHVNQQLATDLKAESLYEHVSLSRLLAHVVTSLSAKLSSDGMDDILQQVWKGTLSVDEADKQLLEIAYD